MEGLRHPGSGRVFPLLENKLTGAIDFRAVPKPRGYLWELTPAKGKALHGIPWAPQDTRCARLHFTSKGQLGAAVRLEVRCQQEDLEIRDVKLPGWNRFKLTKRAAALAYIRQRLFEMSLPHDENLETEPWATLTLADFSLHQHEK